MNHFGSLDENKLKDELENITNQYLKLSEEEQLKYASDFLYVCRMFVEEIDKITLGRLLATLNKVLFENGQSYSWFENFEYLHILYRYLSQTKEYEEYSILFENESYFSRILELVFNDDLEDVDLLDAHILLVFVRLFESKSLPEEKRIYFKSELESLFRFIFENHDIDSVVCYWYFELDELVSIFQFDHLKTINNYYMENPQSDYVGKYLDFVSRRFDVVIKDSIDVVRKIAEENDSDIIRDQAIKLVKKYDERNNSDEGAILKKESDTGFILSENYKELLKQAESIIDDIRSNLIVDSKDLKTIGPFGHYTKIDTLTNFLIKADWKNENNSETQPPFLRLTNLKQLNDPMEGRVIYDYLGIDNTFFQQYQTSNVFISSLTTVSDSLPMWKEYADSSQGAFLEYDLSYLEDIVAHKYIEFVKIHYLDLNSDNTEEPDVDKSLSKLKQIFEKLKELEAEEELKSFAEKLKKISYLFKVKDYEYEMEYRILINLDDTAIQNIIKRDANDSSNEKYFKKEEIGLEVFDKVNYNDFRKYIVLSSKDNGRYDLFVYINLLPLKYSKVILGPKITDADYIAPYLKLANPDIEIESSKIPYR
ncbi:hypothetical protein HMPREF9178_0349 [Streptococcus mitis bv. 2 str. F0392]|uniref:DUF2971 domain-containing protein n=1 Tax=Streptococcus mitis bv. 2 str. F0392 TaxID=768726 RepID=F9NZI5_STROR|nr:hypothetical protein HMPREF9178_0349 [Streptococcus mitis bv. 2 str. F0392]